MTNPGLNGGRAMLELAEKIRSRCILRENGCLEWQGAKNTAGYGTIWLGRQRFSTHRGLYLAEKGPIANGLQLDHLCRNPKCCNPDHLEPVTAQENTRRGNAGLAAKLAGESLTQCCKGHPYPENAHTTKRGRRQCRACSMIRQAKRRAANREKGLTQAGFARERAMSQRCLSPAELIQEGRYVRQ